MTHTFRRIFRDSKFKIAAIISAITLAVTVLAPALPAHAAQITSRKLTLSSSAPNPATSTYTFSFTTATSASIGSMRFQFCTSATPGCSTVPTGLTTTSATLSAQSGAGTAFTINNTTNGSPYITRTAATLAPSAVSFTLSNITNPTATATPGNTFYVQITTYTGTDGATGPTDTGFVTGAIVNQMTVTASVPETLTFCTGTSGITSTSCSGATGSSVSLGTLSTASTGAATSQMGATTNAGSGYIITVNGTTLTSGSNTIAAMNPATTSTQGTAQFGINLMANTTPSIGSAVAGAGSAVPVTGYNTANTFKFLTGDTVASVGVADDFRLFTVSYIANISNVTPPGTYSTAVTYICTATY